MYDRSTAELKTMVGIVLMLFVIGVVYVISFFLR